MDDARLRRAGLDYHEYADVRRHAQLTDLNAALPQSRLLAFSTRGATRYDQNAFVDEDILLFGPETRGLPASVLEALPESQRLYIPQQYCSRSLNLSNSVAVAAYEAWRQKKYA